MRTTTSSQAVSVLHLTNGLKGDKAGLTGIGALETAGHIVQAPENSKRTARTAGWASSGKATAIVRAYQNSGSIC